jgi:hypothetical protein
MVKFRNEAKRFVTKLTGQNPAFFTFVDFRPGPDLNSKHGGSWRVGPVHSDEREIERERERKSKRAYKSATGIDFSIR